MRKMNICFVAPLPPPYGGIANWMRMLATYLDEHEKDSIEYSIVNISPGKRITDGRSMFERVFGGTRIMLKAGQRVKAIIKDRCPDCIHITTSGSLSFFRDIHIMRIAHKYGVKTVLHIRFGRVPDLLNSNGWESKALKKCLTMADTVIAIDKATYDAVCKYGLANKAKHIPLFIDTSEFPPVCEEKEKIISYVGWLVPTKGIAELLESWDVLSEETCLDGWKLRLIGPYKQDYKSDLESRFKCRNVEFMGEQSHKDTLNLVNEGLGFVLPSYSEGFPNAVVEAMALGERIVATDVGAIPEMLEDGCGVVVPAKDSEMLFEALKSIMNGCDSMAMQARKKAIEQYSICNVLEQYKKIWNTNSQ